MVSAFEQSPFLLALGKALLYNLGEGAILYTLFLFFKNGLTAKNAQAKYNLALGSYLLLFLLLVANFIYFFTSKSISQTDPVYYNSIFTNVITQPTVTSFRIESLFSIISIGYLLAVIILLSRLAIYYKRVQSLFNPTLKNAPVHLEKFIEKISFENGILKKVQIWICDHIDVPATVGFFKPVIFLPVSIITNLSLPQVEAIILHELAHIKRNDYLVNIMLALFSALLFFNPFNFILLKIIREERENCCDDFVLNYQYDGLMYAAALFNIEKERIQKLELVLAAVSGKNELLKRMKRINGISEKGIHYPKLATIIFFVLIAVSLPFFIFKFESNLGIFKSHEGLGQNFVKKITQVKKPANKSITENSVNTNKVYTKVSVQPLSIGNTISKRIEEPVSPAVPAIPKNLSKIATTNETQFAGLDMNEINSKIKAAAEELKKVNWADIENQVNKSLKQFNQKQALINNVKAKHSELLQPEKQEFDFQKLQKNIEMLIRDSIRIAGAVILQKQYSHITANANKLVNEILKDTARYFTRPKINSALLP
ncbi:MAG: M56 family metallopeptidase [Ginsengibacter sp.]